MPDSDNTDKSKSKRKKIAATGAMKEIMADYCGSTGRRQICPFMIIDVVSAVRYRRY